VRLPSLPLQTVFKFGLSICLVLPDIGASRSQGMPATPSSVRASPVGTFDHNRLSADNLRVSPAVPLRLRVGHGLGADLGPGRARRGRFRGRAGSCACIPARCSGTSNRNRSEAGPGDNRPANAELRQREYLTEASGNRPGRFSDLQTHCVHTG
jgi:hypothetical protein